MHPTRRIIAAITALAAPAAAAAVIAAGPASSAAVPQHPCFCHMTAEPGQKVETARPRAPGKSFAGCPRASDLVTAATMTAPAPSTALRVHQCPPGTIGV
jgi:hypothetical protein